MVGDAGLAWLRALSGACLKRGSLLPIANLLQLLVKFKLASRPST